jgi:hypothetical protein
MMTENNNQQKPLDLVVDKSTFNLIIREVTKNRKEIGDGRTFTYSEIVFPWKEKQIRITPCHFPLDKVLKNANGNCNDCYGKGYYFSLISKQQYPDPSAFLVDEETLPKDKSDEEQKKWRESQKDVTTWRVMQICLCAVKKTHKKYPGVLSNAYHNIWMTLDYEIEDKIEEQE